MSARRTQFFSASVMALLACDTGRSIVGGTPVTDAPVVSDTVDVVADITVFDATIDQAPPDVPPLVDVVAPDVDAAAQTYLGTEFFAVTTINRELPRAAGFSFAVALGNPNPAPAMIRISRGNNQFSRQLTIAPNSVEVVRLPWVEELSSNDPRPIVNCTEDEDAEAPPYLSSLVPNGAYRIESSVPINAYQFNPLEYRRMEGSCTFNSATNDASLLLPTAAIGTRYRALTYRTPGSFIAIAATAPGTTRVTIRLSRIVAPGVIGVMNPNVSSMFSLEQGAVAQFISLGDLSGSTIEATAPVAVFVGSSCTQISYPNDDQPACDHIEEQLFPEASWGREYVGAVFRDRGMAEYTVFRVMAGAQPTGLTFLPASVHAPEALMPNTTLDFRTNTDFVLQATAPVLVAQFMEGQRTTPGATVGDPSMLLAVPTNQYRRDYSFSVPETYTQNFMYLTMPASTSLQLDGREIGGLPTSIMGTPWNVLRLDVSPGAHVLRSTNNTAFGLIVLGVAPFTSYAFPGGLDLRTN